MFKIKKICIIFHKKDAIMKGICYNSFSKLFDAG